MSNLAAWKCHPIVSACWRTRYERLHPARVVFALVSIFFVVTSAEAYDPLRAKANLSGDIVDCMTYYQLGAINANQMNRPDAVAQLNKSKDFALRMLLALRPEDSEVPKIKADIELSIKLFVNTVKEEGWSRVTLKYADSCRDLLQDPGPRMQYWLDKQD